MLSVPPASTRTVPFPPLRFPPVQLNAPATVSVPLPEIVPVPLRFSTVLAANEPLPAVSVFAPTESVWVPAGAPTSSRANAALTSRFTV